jgi:hypothetical protein
MRVYGGTSERRCDGLFKVLLLQVCQVLRYYCLVGFGETRPTFLSRMVQPTEHSPTASYEL